MRYRRVCIESIGYTLPSEVVTTAQLEAELSPVYERLRLPAGRLELMSGIRERRFWPPKTTISEVSVRSGLRAIEAAQINPSRIGALVHGSVCRDFLEPATASRVHYQLGLPAACTVYDLSNACLGMLNGILQVADMIELGRIEAGLVVGTEQGWPLVDNTVKRLNRDLDITRESIKSSIASLTIGSASAAVLLCSEEQSRTGNRLEGSELRARTSQHDLCCSDGLETVMHTDSERLLHEGVATAAETFTEFLRELNWQSSDIDKIICHQVGAAHRKRLLQALGLDEAIDFSTLELLGNTGAAALPVTLGVGMAQGHIEANDRVALLGIGSGIHCLMLGLHWQKSLVLGDPLVAQKTPLRRTASADRGRPVAAGS